MRKAVKERMEIPPSNSERLVFGGGISTGIPVTAAGLHQQLLGVLESALTDADPSTPIGVLAERIYQSAPILMKRLMLERLTWLLYRTRRRIAASKQLLLPGFEKLPGRIVLKDGRWTQLKKASLGQLREYRSVLLKRRDPRIKYVDRLISLFQRHGRRGKQLDVSDVVLKESERLERLTPGTIN